MPAGCGAMTPITGERGACGSMPSPGAHEEQTGGCVYMGIDPGDKGGIACLRGSQIKCIPMPGRSMQESGNELINCIQVITEGRQNVICVLEQAQSMPGQGIVSTFNYGVGYGILRGILISLNISTKMVASTPWKRKMGLLVKKLPGESKSEHKKRCKEKSSYICRL